MLHILHVFRKNFPEKQGNIVKFSRTTGGNEERRKKKKEKQRRLRVYEKYFFKTAPGKDIVTGKPAL